MTTKTALALFDDPAAAVARGRRTGADIQLLPLGGRHYLKKPGAPDVEPRFLCSDGRWRRYDLIPELPGSAAAAETA